MFLSRIAPMALAAALVAPVALAPASADAATYSIDGAHTNVGFKIRHLAVSWVRGHFGQPSGTVTIDDAGNLTAIDVTIPVDSIDTDNAKRDGHLKSPDFFDVAKHPNIKFKSSKVTKNGDAFEVAGDLTMKGVTKPVTRTVTDLTGEVQGPQGPAKRGASATATINREDFGVDWNKPLDGGGVVVGKEVKIEIEVELNKG